MAWAVIILLYNWLSAIYWTPGPLNSNLINTEKAVPNNPENNANIRYNVPISLAFEDKYIFPYKTERFNKLVSLDSLFNW
jgi:hypothetical protein